MDSVTLLSMLEFARARLLGSLDAIEKCGEPANEVLLWRPAPNRAHIAWQAVHCAATHDKYLNVIIKGQAQPTDPSLVTAFGGGSTPSDVAPTLASIRQVLDRHFAPLRTYVSQLTAAEMNKVVGPPDRQRKIGDAIVLLGWHEAHHQGQLHLTWNLYRQANGLV